MITVNELQALRRTDTQSYLEEVSEVVQKRDREGYRTAAVGIPMRVDVLRAKSILEEAGYTVKYNSGGGTYREDAWQNFTISWT